MPKTKRTVYLVTDYGGEWENAWEFPYMAFDTVQAANECAEKRKMRNWRDPIQYPESIFDEYCSSRVIGVRLLMDEPTCHNVYLGDCTNGFMCSACGEVMLDADEYFISGSFNYCPGCGRKVVKRK